MNRKQLLLIVAAGLLLGGFGWHLHRQKSASFEHGGKTTSEKLLGDFPVNDVAQITIRHSTNELNLVKGEVWSVKERADYPADAGEIIEFARKLWDLHAAQSQGIGQSQLGRLELLPPGRGGTNSATLVELKGKDGKLIRSVLLGKKSMRAGGDESPGGGWPNGRWICLPDKPGTAYVVGETFDRVEPKPEEWLSKDFIRVEKPKSIEVAFPVPTNSWKLTRETESGEWKLADAKPGEQLDSSKIAGVSNPFGSPGFTDVLPAADVQKSGMDKPTVVTIDTFDNFAYTLTVGQKTNDDYPLSLNVAAHLPKERTPGKDEKPEDKTRLDKEFQDNQKKLESKLGQEKKFENWIYLVSNWTVEPVLKERAQLLAEKKEEPKPGEKSSTNDVNAVTNFLSPPDDSKR